MNKKTIIIIIIISIIIIIGISLYPKSDADNKKSDVGEGGNLCDLNKEYTHDAVNSVNCTCPNGYKFELVSTSFGPCPEEGMIDCPKSTLKCVKE